jgi:immune inhibitor A
VLNAEQTLKLLRRVIIVLVDFPDVEMAPSTKERVKDLWFSVDRKVPTGSVKEYFSEVSNCAVEFAGEVIGPFTLSHKLSHYSNRSKRHHPMRSSVVRWHWEDSGRGSQEPNTQTMANEAFESAIESAELDLEGYDNDGNGYVQSWAVHLLRANC